MQAYANLSAGFVPDQSTEFEVKVWDTPCSFLESDLASTGMQLRVREPVSVADWGAYTASWLAASATSAESAFANVASTAIVSDGRIPQVQQYWGSGAPNWWGASKRGMISACFSGVLNPTAQRAWFMGNTSITFACAGSGLLKIVKVPASGAPMELLSAELTEVGYLQNGFTYSLTDTFVTGDRIRVYYLQRGTEDWGGLVVKVVAGTVSADQETRNQQAAESPVLSCGLFSHETPMAGTTLSFVSAVEIQQELGNAARATLSVPLINPNPERNDGHGWLFIRQSDADPGALQLMDQGTAQIILRRKRLVQITAKVPDATGSPSTRVPLFTGYVDDFSDIANGEAKIVCVGFEGRLVEQYEQAPDRVSYMSRNFRLLDPMRAETWQRGQPVYNVPAFDAWPLTYAVEELAVRAGIDPSRFRRAFSVMKNDGTVGTPSTSWLQYKFRAYTTNGRALRLPRPVHYGNAGVAFTETRQIDDAYLFKVEPTKDLWARVRELTDRMGYRVRFDENGDAVLYPSNNPTHVVDLTTSDVVSGTATSKTNPAAYGAKYLEATSAVTISKTVDAARIDVSFPRAAGVGSWTVNVRRSGAVVHSMVVDPSANIGTPQFLFNASLVQPGSNATVVTVWPPVASSTSLGYGTYTVELVGAADGSTRLADALLCYATDPDRSALPGALDTSDLAISARATQTSDEMRNKVTIVGRRKALVTDSDKFADSKQPTEQEFVVQNAVDYQSITNPSALNYVGYPKQAIVYDSSIADDGFARYLSQVFIYRQSVPKPGAEVEAILLPMIQPGDPVLVTESKFDTLTSSTVYAKTVTHRYTKGRATTTITGQAWPDYPAYEPRYDINLADFDNQPVIDITLAYVTLSGHVVSNLNGDAVRPVLDTPATGSPAGNIVSYTNVSASGSTIALPGGAPWPPVPGTLQVRQRTVVATGATVETRKTRDLFRWKAGQQLIEMQLPPNWAVQQVQADVYNTFLGRIVNGPYTVGSDQNAADIKYYYKIIGRSLVLYGATDRPTVLNLTGQYDLRLKVFYKTTSGEQRLDWVANNPYHQFTSFSYADGATSIALPWKQGDDTTRFQPVPSTWDVRYKRLYAAGGSDPNVLPSGVADNGQPYSPFYDPYTSELGNLVSVGFASLVEGLYRVSIRSVYDDTIVAWMTGNDAAADEPEKHWEYLPVGVNQFYWDGVDQVGEWNARQSELYASLVDGSFGEDSDTYERVGKGYYAWNQEVGGGRYPQLAYIWLKRDANGKPIIGHGTYAQWYIAVESISDQLPGTVVVDSVDDTNPTNGQYVYTHLPEPTKVSLKIDDWVSGSAYDPTALSGVSAGSVDANWATLSSSTPAVNQVFASINNAKPMRMRFYVEQRPGFLWEGKRDEVSVKLTRHVHLRAYIADQTIIDKGSSYPGTTTRERVIANRRLCNDEHTNTYGDSGFRKGKSFKWTTGDTGTTEWIFRPQDFKREFNYGGLEESIGFGKYLQLEEVPGWSNTRDLASERSRLQFALMSYLFYLSSMVTDRSGRTTWGLNTSFVDKSKLVNNVTATTFGDDPMYLLRRTVACRQWVGEPGWKSGQLSTYGASSGSLMDKLLEHWWWQHESTATTIGTTESAWSSMGCSNDEYSAWHVSTSDFQPKLPSSYSAARQLGSASASAVTGW